MRTLVVAVLALTFLVSISASQAEEILERGNGADPTTLDPQQARSAAEANILRDLYEGLLTYDAGGHLIPGAAEAWTVSDDRLTYSFTLRVASWSNGTPVIAADFIRAFRRLIDPATAAPDAGLFRALAGAEAIQAGEAAPSTLGVVADGQRTLIILLDREEPLLLHLLARPAAMPISRSANLPLAPGIVAPFNGAYRFDRFEPEAGVWLAKNPHFRDVGEVAFDRIAYRGFDRETAIRLFREGGLAIVNDVPIHAVEEFRAGFADSLRQSPFAGTFFLAANLDGVLTDRNLRRAVSLAVDRVALAEVLWRGAMMPTLAIVPVGVADLADPAQAAIGPNDQDVRRAEARTILAELGYEPDNPLHLTLAYGAGSVAQATANSIARDLAEIGIAATLVGRPPAEHHRHLTGDRDFDLAAVAWIGELGHVDEFLLLFAGRDMDVTGYANSHFDSLIAEARIAPDRTVRTALYAAADRALMRDLTAIPLMHYTSLNLVSVEVAGWQDNVIDVHLSRWLSPRAAEAAP